jgi:hypothetical protein
MHYTHSGERPDLFEQQSSSKMTKKRKATDGVTGEGSQHGDSVHGDTSKSQKLEKDAADFNSIEHTPLTLDEIKASIKRLSSMVPTLPAGGINEKDVDTVNEWALVRVETTLS